MSAQWLRRRVLVLISAWVFAALAHAQVAQRYSYYSPGRGTVNIDITAVEPRLFSVRGQPLPGDVVVLTAISRRLMRIRPDGSVRWLLNVRHGGGAHGLDLYKDRLVVALGREVLFVNPANGDTTELIRLLDDDSEPISFLRVQGDILIVGESASPSRIVIARLGMNNEGKISVTVVQRIATRTQYPRDAIVLDDGTLVIADTFGHALVFLQRSDRWREVRRMPEYYPNALSRVGEDLVVLSEHGNRLSRWNLREGIREVLLACPHPLFQDPLSSPQQITAEEPATVADGLPPRQLCSTQVVGDQTLYAPNGYALDRGTREVWIADADNHRIAFFVDGAFSGAIENINHPVRVIPESLLPRAPSTGSAKSRPHRPTTAKP